MREAPATLMASRTGRQTSSGGVVFREHGGALEVCLIARRIDGKLIWGLPKGHVEAGEELQATALREVREETGVHGEPITRLGSVGYSFTVRQEDIRYAKTVHFYLLRYRHGSLEDHDDEVEQAAWVPMREAQTRLFYGNERRILRKAERYLAQHPEIGTQHTADSTQS